MWKMICSKIKRKNADGQLVFLFVFLVSLSAGLLISYIPRALHRQAEKTQSTLLESIELGEGTLVLDPQLVDLQLDFYDNDDTDMGDPVALPESGSVDGIGILTIDRIGMRLPVTHGIGDAQLKVSVGHVPQTAVVGEVGNAVIIGHRSYRYGQLFNRLGEIQAGDVMEYQSIDGESFTFVVDEVVETTPDDPAAVQQPEDRIQITLYTCTPIQTATHRLYVRASLID